MTKEQIITLKESRLNKLKSNGKNIDSNGVIRKLERELRNFKKQLDKTKKIWYNKKELYIIADQVIYKNLGLRFCLKSVEQKW